MILRLDNPLFVSKILDLAKVVPDLPIDTLKNMVLTGINNKNTAIYIDNHNDDLRGCIYASIERWNGEDVGFIQLCVVKPIREEKYICFELLNKIRLWARLHNLKKLVFNTRRNYKAFERKYGFKLDSYILTKEC